MFVIQTTHLPYNARALHLLFRNNSGVRLLCCRTNYNINTCMKNAVVGSCFHASFTCSRTELITGVQYIEHLDDVVARHLFAW